jgi:hypothetical protein
MSYPLMLLLDGYHDCKKPEKELIQLYRWLIHEVMSPNSRKGVFCSYQYAHQK